MKLVITFFLVLLAGFAHAYASSPHDNICRAGVVHIGNAQIKGDRVDGPFIISNDEGRENPLLAAVEDVDEDTLIRRNSSPAGYLLVISETFISYQLDSCPSQLSSWKHRSSPDSCKYIVHRVLRI
jgi:hypothetical protein